MADNGQPETALAGDGPPTLGLSAPNGGPEATLVSSAAGAAGALAGRNILQLQNGK